MKYLDQNVLKQIAQTYILQGSFVPSLGLFDGKMGICIFFFHYARYTKDPLYEDFAGELIDEICEDIHDSIPIQMNNGLCGIGWGIAYLLKNNFIDGDADTILEEIDRKIMERDVRRIKDTSLDTGLKGIICYALGRLNTPKGNSWLLKHQNYIRELEYASLSLIINKKCIFTNTLQEYLAKKEVNTSYESYILRKITSSKHKLNTNEDSSWQKGLKHILK